MMHTMSHATSESESTSISHSNFDSIFNSALNDYKNRTGQDLASHPLLPTLQACNSLDAVLGVLRNQIPLFGESHNADDRLTKLLIPTVNVLYGFSATLGKGVSLVNITMPPVWKLSSDIYLTGILTSESDHGRCRSFTPGLCPS